MRLGAVIFTLAPLSGFPLSPVDTTSSPNITHSTEHTLNCPRAPSPSEWGLTTLLELEKQGVSAKKTIAPGLKRRLSGGRDWHRKSNRRRWGYGKDRVGREGRRVKRGDTRRKSSSCKAQMYFKNELSLLSGVVEEQSVLFCRPHESLFSSGLQETQTSLRIKPRLGISFNLPR